ncbi:MAG: exodeoxyribonuclease V subunit gamma [Desulfobacterales bacterium]|jgi:exodeoxyribonuclease V gamma subunit
MAGLSVYTSNRLEILAEKLARTIQTPLPTPLTPEVIVVQSRGMERWISIALAELNGVSANCSFPFPNAFLEDLFKELMPDLPDFSLFDREIMTFRLMKIIPRCKGENGFEDLKDYLAEDRNHLRLYQLAGKIADLFDQYQVFRPQWLFQWEQSKEEKKPPYGWQARLWRELTCGHEKLHRAWLQKILRDRIRDRGLDPIRLPARVSLFGISHLPFFHLQTFAELSRLIEVNLFLIDPCREYWADIVSDREIKKIRHKNPQIAENIEWYHFEKGNRLLAAMGTVGRDFFELISGLDCEIIENFEEPQQDSLLGCLQADILNLRDRGINMLDGPVGLATADKMDANLWPEMCPLPEQDTSVQVHSCHSPMREIEVLHDNLLAMFEEDPALLPKDIIVMAPDIEIYAPIIQAVFDSQTDRSLRIPYSIADQSPRTEGRMIDGFLALLDAGHDRFGASQVLSLLEFPGIKERFDLRASDQKTIEHWVQDTQIRWGIDADSRRAAGLGEFSENTWQTGLERLLLGYAMPGKNRHLFNGILPYDNIEGSDAQILGNFLNFIDCLIDWSAKLEQPMTLGQWRLTLTAIVDRFFLANDKEERELQILRNLLDDLADIEKKAGLDDEITPAVVKSYLTARLEQNRYGSGFLTGGITFCAMLPMRSIPFKIICLVGMNNDAYPRDYQPLNFDLMARHPRPGDRSRRNDDKYLFLESIISARKKLYISYVGQSIQDNSLLPPSVLVSELIDTIQKGLVDCEQEPVRKIETRHRLQPFSPWYFRSGTGLFSYSMENMLAGMAPKVDPLPFVPSGIPLSPEETVGWQKIDLDSLDRFFGHPARFFIQQRLGILLQETSLLPEDRENFDLINLEKYLVEQNMLKARMAGLELQDFKAVQKALGKLPHGRVGDVYYDQMSIEVENFVSKIEPFTHPVSGNSVDVDLNIAGFNLSGRISDIAETGSVTIHYARKKARVILTAWINHLVLCQATRKASLPTSLLICKDLALQFKPVPESNGLLADLLNLLRRGVEKPLHFFPESSYEYAEHLLNKSASDSAALAKAGLKWRGGNSSKKFTFVESDDPYYDLCFRRADPLDDEFKKIAVKVFEPLIAYSREIIL